MATISIADNDARIQHDIGSGGNTAGVTPFPIDFPFFNLDDIDVTITNSSGVDTAISRGTGANTFSVSGTAVDDGFSGGNVILNTQYTSSTVTISRDIPIERISDFATSGPFNISSLNTDLDKIYAVMQQLETNNARALSLPTTDTLTSILDDPSNGSINTIYLLSCFLLPPFIVMKSSSSSLAIPQTISRLTRVLIKTSFAYTSNFC